MICVDTRVTILCLKVSKIRHMTLEMAAIFKKWAPKWRIQWHDISGNRFSEIYSPENLYRVDNDSATPISFWDMVRQRPFFLNGCHSPHRGNLAWHYSLIIIFVCHVHACQIWCFYHKMHDSLIFGHLAAGLNAVLVSYLSFLHIFGFHISFKVPVVWVDCFQQVCRISCQCACSWQWCTACLLIWHWPHCLIIRMTCWEIRIGFLL